MIDPDEGEITLPGLPLAALWPPFGAEKINVFGGAGSHAVEFYGVPVRS